MGDQDLNIAWDGADSPGLTPIEAAELVRSMTELTLALKGFISVVGELYPHIEERYPLMRRLWVQRENSPRLGREIPHEEDAETPTDP